MKNILYCLLLLSCYNVKAQISPTEIKSKIDTIRETMLKYCNSKISEVQDLNHKKTTVSLPSYQKYIDQYFTYLSYNRGTLPTGNSAAIEITNNSTQLDLSLSQKIESKRPGGPITLLTAGIKAKIDDGISNLFSGANLNSGTSLFLNFSRLPGNSIYRIKAIIAGFDPNGRPVHTEFDELMKRREKYVTYFCENSAVTLPDEYRALIDCWENIQLRLSSAATCDKAELFKKKEEIEKQLTDAGLLSDTPAKISKGLQKKYLDKMYDIEVEDKSWLSVRFIWLSGGIVYTRQSFNTYDENSTFAKRFGSKDFDEVGVKLTLNYFKENINQDAHKGAHYANISYQPKTTNSYLLLKNLDILRNIIRSTNPDTSYSIQTNQKAKNITGKKYKTGWTHTISAASTNMFGKNQNAGLNINASWLVSGFTRPVFSAHIGTLLRLSNNNYDPSDKKSSAKVNFEIFIEFNDMTDVGASGKSIWQNKIIGINTSVPFNKIFFK